MRRGVTDGGLLFGNVEVNTRRHSGNLKWFTEKQESEMGEEQEAIFCYKP